jgi:hypothetical protein
MGRILQRIVAVVMLLLAAGMFTAATTDSWARASGTTPPTVELVGPGTLTEHLTAVKNERGKFAAVFNLSVENDGQQTIAAPKAHGGGGYQLSVVSDRSYSGTAPTITASSPFKELAPAAVTSVKVTLTVYDKDTTSLTAVLRVMSPSGVAPSTETITLTRSLKSSNFIGILIGSLILGASVVITSIVWQKKPEPTDPKIIYTDATFSFSQSWATSIAAVLTVLATVFSTTGVLTNLVPGIDTGFFLAVTIVYGVVLTLAPLVYSTLQKPDGSHVYGSHLGFVIAAAITAVAVGGQLSTVGAIVWLSDPNPWVRWVFLGFLVVVALVVTAYTEATRRQLWQLPKPTADSTAPAPLVTAMAALP